MSMKMTTIIMYFAIIFTENVLVTYIYLKEKTSVACSKIFSIYKSSMTF